jgi:hypothetical protein
VRHGLPFGRIELKTGIAALVRLVDQAMSPEPYRCPGSSGPSGPSHRGDAAVRRRQERYPTVVLVPTPTHARWLNQVEISDSVLERKVLTPSVAEDLLELALRILSFEASSREELRRFRWRFTREDLERRVEELAAIPAQPPSSRRPRHDPSRNSGTDH